MVRMVTVFGLGCSIVLAGATCEQDNALSLVQMMVQKQFPSLSEDNVTGNTTLSSAVIKEIVKDVVEQIIEATMATSNASTSNATVAADSACHDMAGEYEDQKQGNIIFVNQTGCLVSVDMAWDEIRGRVVQQGTVEADRVTISEFDEAGEFTANGDVIFPDGGHWKKTTSELSNSTNASNVTATATLNDTSANASAAATSDSGLDGADFMNESANAQVAQTNESALGPLPNEPQESEALVFPSEDPLGPPPNEPQESEKLVFPSEDPFPSDSGLQQQRVGAESVDEMSSETNASVVSSASHWGSSGTCKVTEDTFFSVFDGVKADASLLEADIDSDTDTDTNTDAGFRLTGMSDADLKDGEAKDLWLVRGRAHDGSTVRIAARYWRNASSTGHQVFLKSLAISGGFITNRTLIVRPLQDEITWNNQKETYAILKKEESAFSIEGLVSAKRKASTSGSTVEVELPKEVKLLITRHQKYVNVAISMPPLATQDGLCGNFNGDSSDDTLGMILARGPRVKDENSMFPAEWVPPKAAPAPVA